MDIHIKTFFDPHFSVFHAFNYDRIIPIQFYLASYCVFFSHQKMNILIVHQSIVDTCSSVATLMTALIDVDGTRLSRDSAYDQLVCRIWLTRALLWNSMITSTYGILLTAVERYAAVIYPVWYNVCVAYSYFRRFFLQLRDLFPFLLLRTLCAERM